MDRISKRQLLSLNWTLINSDVRAHGYHYCAMNGQRLCKKNWTGSYLVVDLTINTNVARQILTNFVKSEVTRVGYRRAVIGLSGGVDSALSFALAVEALGAENVLAVRMPYKSSSADSLEHAQMLIDQFKVQSETIDVTTMVEPLIERDPQISK